MHFVPLFDPGIEFLESVNVIQLIVIHKYEIKHIAIIQKALLEKSTLINGNNNDFTNCNFSMMSDSGDTAIVAEP